jgi:hypothetical protein
MPTVETFARKIENVLDILPESTRIVTPSDRRREVDARQRHIQRRWRQY